MVTFEPVEAGLAVKVDGVFFGIISPEHGFYQNGSVHFLRVSSHDLMKVARRSELEQGFVTCPHCGGVAKETSFSTPLIYKEYRCSRCDGLTTVSQSEFDVVESVAAAKSAA